MASPARQAPDSIALPSETQAPDVKPSTAAAPKTSDSSPSRVELSSEWLNGLQFKSADDNFRLRVGGSVQVDSTWLTGTENAFILPNGSTSGVGNAAATFLRRVRLRAGGQIYDQFDFVLEYDFANANNENSGQEPPSFGNIAGSPSPCSIWMQVRDVPVVGDVRLGHLIKPIGMTLNTSHASLPFMERPDNTDAFYAPFDGGYALGVVARNRTEDERVTWQYGVYRPTVTLFGVAVNKGEWGGRMTALPIFEDDGCRLVHVGLGTLNGELPQNQLRLRDRPMLRNGPGYAVPILVDTGEINGSRQYSFAPELAAVLGPWTFQAEWTWQLLTNAMTIHGADQGTGMFQGGYAEMLYFLTGEHQEYEKRDGVFGRVVPRRNLRFSRTEGCAGPGAWQVGLRVSYLDLNSNDIQGGTVYDWTAGLNWYWNPNMKVQFNYIIERRNQPGVEPSWINGFGIRGAYNF